MSQFVAELIVLPRLPTRHGFCIRAQSGLASMMKSSRPVTRPASAPRLARKRPQYLPLFTWSLPDLAYRSFHNHFGKSMPRE
jgi:hypothetical protein